jgi:hypothetical protein
MKNDAPIPYRHRRVRCGGLPAASVGMGKGHAQAKAVVSSDRQCPWREEATAAPGFSKEDLRDWFCIPVLSGASTRHHKLFQQKHLKSARSGFRKDRLFASGTSGWLKLAEEITGEEAQVGGAFGESTHEVGKPVLAVGNVDADAKTVADQPALQIGAHAVEHLELKIAFRDL